MKQEDKELLIKDLCARLPYDIKCKILETNEIKILSSVRHDWENTLFDFWEDGRKIQYEYQLYLSEFKPYLYPFSSMTEEQYNSLRELGILNNCSHNYEYVNSYTHGVSFIFKQFKTHSLELIEWLNKNHFDYRGLIEKGLAIDCTNLNIY